jgi:type I restriction enzyme M protein
MIMRNTEQTSKETLNEVERIVDKYSVLSANGHFLNTYPQRIALLKELYRCAAGEKANQQVLDILSESQYEYKDDYILEEEKSFLVDHLEQSFSCTVNPFEYSRNKDGNYLQPSEVTSLLVEMAGIPKDVTVYNPFAGLCSYAVAFPDNHVQGEEIDPVTWAIAQIRLFAYHISADIRLADSFETLQSEGKFDVIVSTPFYSNEEGREMQDIVSSLYDKLADNGTLACIVPSVFLSSDKKAEQIRMRLIKDRAIQYVFLLPEKIFAGTSTQYAILVVTKRVESQKDQGLFLADASEYTRFEKNPYRVTTFDYKDFLEDLKEEIVDFEERGCYIDDSTIGAPFAYGMLHGSDLMPSHYLLPSVENGVSLGELMEEIPMLTDGSASTDCFITPSSIPEANHSRSFELRDNKREHQENLAAKMIHISSDCIIVAQCSSTFKTVYVKNPDKTVAYAMHGIRFFKPKNGYSAQYIAALITTKSVKKQIEVRLKDSLADFELDKINIADIVVPNHKTGEERQHIIDDVISSEMTGLEHELQDALANQKREVRSTRHAMIQTLSALSSNWEQLKMFAKIKGGKIDLTDYVGNINPISVKELMNSIEYAISTLERQVDALKFDKMDWGKDEKINPAEFINDYIRLYSTPSIIMRNVKDGSTFDTACCKDTEGVQIELTPTFYAPKQLVERIFNNIVANAKAHGFTDGSKPNHEIRFDWENNNDNVIITISNNGVPLKEGVKDDDVLMSGFTTALNEVSGDGTLHSGHGGFEIKSLMESLGAVKVISQPEEEFPVAYRLTFRKFETQQ